MKTTLSPQFQTHPIARTFKARNRRCLVAFFNLLEPTVPLFGVPTHGVRRCPDLPSSYALAAVSTGDTALSLVRYTAPRTHPSPRSGMDSGSARLRAL